MKNRSFISDVFEYKFQYLSKYEIDTFANKPTASHGYFRHLLRTYTKCVNLELFFRTNSSWKLKFEGLILKACGWKHKLGPNLIRDWSSRTLYTCSDTSNRKLSILYETVKLTELESSQNMRIIYGIMRIFAFSQGYADLFFVWDVFYVSSGVLPYHQSCFILCCFVCSEMFLFEYQMGGLILMLCIGWNFGMCCDNWCVVVAECCCENLRVRISR